MPREAPVTRAVRPVRSIFIASLSTNFSIDGTSETLINSTEESMRLISPVSTLPGPISTKRRTPIAIIFCTDSTQRTGDATWRTSALRTAVAVPIGDASTFETSDIQRSLKCASSRIGRSRSSAGFISAQWNGADTGSGSARRTPRALATSMARSMAAFVPAMTICPGALMFATDSDVALRRFLADRARFVDRRPDQRGHPAGADRHGVLHEPAAHAHDLRGLGRRQAADADDRAVLAEGVAGHDVAPGRAAFFEHGVNRGRHGENRRLRVLGELELIVGTFEAELRDREAERGVDVVEDAARGRERLGDVLPHSGVLAPLPGKNERGVVLHARES